MKNTCFVDSEAKRDIKMLQFFTRNLQEINCMHGSYTADEAARRKIPFVIINNTIHKIRFAINTDTDTTTNKNVAIYDKQLSNTPYCIIRAYPQKKRALTNLQLAVQSIRHTHAAVLVISPHHRNYYSPRTES